MTVSVRDARGREGDRRWIEGVYRDYLDDLAPLNTGIFPLLGEFGHREPDHIARWFGDPTSTPLVIAKSEEPVGFAMVARGGPQGPGKSRTDYRMAEFFIARTAAPPRHRAHRGAADPQPFRRAAGRSSNTCATRPRSRFWRRVVSAYTQGRYEERVRQRRSAPDLRVRASRDTARAS